MSTYRSLVVGAGGFFIVVFLSGFRLTRTGKPYGTLIFTIHKLIALAAATALGFLTYRVYQAEGLGTLALASVIVTGVLFLGTIVTGGLLSVDLALPAAVRRLHHSTPYFTVLSAALAVFALLRP